MARWIPVPIKNKVFTNVAETTLNAENAALENAYVNELGGISRFPQLVPYVTLGGDAPTYLEEWRGDLIANTGGNTYRIDENGNAQNMTSAVVAGSGRTIFAKTENELLMAAGKQIISFNAPMTKILSVQAPESTFVVFTQGIVGANEPNSGRFSFSSPGQYDQWDPLSIFSAEGKPDDITAILVTEFNELVLAGPDSIEIFEPIANGEQPFGKRGNLAGGLEIDAQYTLLAEDNRVWGINKRREWVAYTTSTADLASGDIQNTLESIDSFKDSWAVALPTDGHRFFVIQFPHATNVYGTLGITLLLDYKAKRWGQLFGWDALNSLPTRWPGWSFKAIGGTKYVGGNGMVYKLQGFTNDGMNQRLLWRSGHISQSGGQSMRIDKGRVRLQRGGKNKTSLDDISPIISFRVNKDNQGFGRWVRRNTGLSGKRDMWIDLPAMGTARSVQFEIMVTDNIAIEIAEMDILVEGLAT